MYKMILLPKYKQYLALHIILVHLSVCMCLHAVIAKHFYNAYILEGKFKLRGETDKITWHTGTDGSHHWSMEPAPIYDGKVISNKHVLSFFLRKVAMVLEGSTVIGS